MNYFWDIEKLFAYFERIWFVNYAYNNKRSIKHNIKIC